MGDRRKVDWSGMLLAVCALTLTSLVLVREMTGGGTEPPPLPDRQLQNWPELVARGRASSDSGDVTILVFGDYECPACRRFHIQALRPALREFGSRVRWVSRHYPLPYHRFAVPAAIAAECAAEDGRFFEMVDALYQFQDSLGLKSLEAVAESAGVSDRELFLDCLEHRRGGDRVEADVATAQELGLTGTPSVAIDGRLLGEVPDGARLIELIEREMKGGVEGKP